MRTFRTSRQVDEVSEVACKAASKKDVGIVKRCISGIRGRTRLARSAKPAWLSSVPDIKVAKHEYCIII